MSATAEPAVATVRPPRKILLAAYHYPPLNSIGARRPHGLATWLRRRGHDVTVLTSVRSGADERDGTKVIRTPDLLATRLNWRGDSFEISAGRMDAIWDPGPGLWGSIVVPDIQLVGWMPFALRKALRLHRRIGFDAVISSSPVESVHAVGLALRRRGVPWIADMRDGWRFEAPRPDWPLTAQKKLDGLLERFTLARADAIVMVTEPLSEDLRNRLGVAVDTITNGFNPDDVQHAGGVHAPIDPRKLTLAHTGGLGHTQSLLPLLEALARIARSDPSVSERVELVLAGPRTAEQQVLHSRPEFAPFIRYVGFVEQPVALAIQRAADLLILITSGKRRGEATGKLFEYIAADKPILSFGTNNAAASIVTAAEAGIAVPTDDSAAAETVVRKALAGELPSPPPPSAREAYAYPAIAERYEQVIERAIARHHGGSPGSDAGAQRSDGGETRSAERAPAPSR